MIYKGFANTDISEMERIYRLSMINSVSGYKPANLVGTMGTDGRENLAIFSSVVHLGSDPALLGMISRPDTVERHTLSNIRAMSQYSINHVHMDQISQAHYTSARWDDGTSEFGACGLTAEHIDGYDVPLVMGSPVRMIMSLVDEVPIEANGTILIIGEIQYLQIGEDGISDDGSIDLASLGTAAISGLDSYHRAERIAKYPYARVGEIPKSMV